MLCLSENYRVLSTIPLCALTTDQALVEKGGCFSSDEDAIAMCATNQGKL